MKKGMMKIALFSFLMMGTTAVQAQAGLKKADRQYDKWAYVDALDIYEKIDKRGFTSQELSQHLGNAYYFNANYAGAYKHYERLFTQYANEDLASEYYYRYAQTLQHMGMEAEAKTYYDAFTQKVGSESQIAKVRLNEAALKKQIRENSGRYDKVINLPINTPFADYGSFVHDNKLYFTSARDTGSLSKKVHTWTGAAFTSLYEYPLQVDEKGRQKVTRLKGDVKSILNESTAVITKDGQTMYFTRNNMKSGKRGYDENQNTLLKIYRATLENGQWSHVEELSINADGFSTAHPTLSKDERTLYFASDRPGGYGNSDLWKVSLNGSTFGVPQNLGAEINTEARETFPYINENDELYFSSDGRVGLGGLDVYVSKMTKDGSFQEVQNLGEPINSNSDDFAYYINYNSKEGFFSSNRTGGKGNDDLYGFLETRALNACKQDLRVWVVNGKTRNMIADATVTLYDAYYNEKGISSQASASGYNFNTDYDCDAKYRLKVEKEGFVTVEEMVTVGVESGLTEKTITLYPRRVEVKPKDDLFKVLSLKPIYFDYDKDNIREDAALELAKVVEVLRDYPRMKIDVRSHTDSRGSDAYNLKLSQRRAKSTAEWMMEQGIDSSRITYKGYGETQLENRCKNGVKCSDAEHEENRRSEFIVTEM